MGHGIDMQIHLPVHVSIKCTQKEDCSNLQWTRIHSGVVREIGGAPFQNFKLTGRGWRPGDLLHESLCPHIRELHLQLEGWSLADWRLFFQSMCFPALTVLRFRCPSDQELYTSLVALPTDAPSTHLGLRSLKTPHSFAL